MSDRLSLICRTKPRPHVGEHLAWGGCQGTVSDWGNTSPCECPCHQVTAPTDLREAVEAARAEKRRAAA